MSELCFYALVALLIYWFVEQRPECQHVLAVEAFSSLDALLDSQPEAAPITAGKVDQVLMSMGFSKPDYQPTPQLIDRGLEAIATDNAAERLAEKMEDLQAMPCSELRALAERLGVPCSTRGRINKATIGAIARLV